MSISKYIWTAARTLRIEVFPYVGEPKALEELEQTIKVLTAVANAMDSIVPDGTSLSATEIYKYHELYQVFIANLAENPAVNANTAEEIKFAAKNIDSMSSDSSYNLEKLAWEKNLIDYAISKMEKVENASKVNNNCKEISYIEKDSLEEYLRNYENNSNLSVLNFSPVLGGRSRQTVAFSVEGSRNFPPNLVFQRTMPGMGEGGGAFNTPDSEFALLKKLKHAGMLVPDPILLESNSDSLGAPFIIFEKVDGKIAQKDYWGTPSSEQFAYQLAKQMATLHREPFTDIADRLIGGDKEEKIQRTEEIEILSGWWFDHSHWPSVTMSYAIKWLRRNAGSVGDVKSIIHNDMLFHNILVNENGITAILDWEQACIGHPGEDLGYVYPAVSKMIGWEKFLDSYYDSGGPIIPMKDLDFFIVRAQVRLMGLVLLNGRRVYEEGEHDQPIIMASAGAHFVQRLLHRLAIVLKDVLSRDPELAS